MRTKYARAIRMGILLARSEISALNSRSGNRIRLAQQDTDDWFETFGWWQGALKLTAHEAYMQTMVTENQRALRKLGIR